MIITNASLSALRTNFSAIFRGAFDATPTFHQNLCATVSASTGIGTYGHLQRNVQIREWVGTRVLQNVKEEAAVIFSQDFEGTVTVDRRDVERDNLGMYTTDFHGLGFATRKHPDKLTRLAIQAGTSSTGFDGVPYFSALHPMDGQSNQSNNFTSKALSAANYAEVRASMMSYVSADGENLGVMPDLLIVPPQLEGTARTILNAETIADANGGGTTNVWRNSARLLVIPELGNQATTWYLADSSKPMKPLILQTTKAPEFVSKVSASDDNVFFDRQLIYGVDFSHAVGYGVWWLMSRAIA